MQRSMRAVAVGSQLLRVAVRSGDGTRPPLVLANGIGASLEVLQPFVDHLDPAIEVIRFDVPGVGGSPLPRLPYRLPRLARLVADHSPARWEAEALGLAGELATFPREDSATSDARPLGWRRGAHRGAPAGRWCERLVRPGPGERRRRGRVGGRRAQPQ